MPHKDEENEVARSLRQPDKVEKEKARIIDIVSEDKQRRDQETSFFRNENLVTYTEVGKQQFVGHRAKPSWKRDYQYNVFDHVTREKVYVIISKTAGLYEAQFFNTNKRLQEVSETVSTVLGAFYADSTRRLKEKEKNKLAMLSALVTPKAIWYEGWRHQKRTVREIEERDPETGRITKTKKNKVVHYNGPWGELIPVEDFVPGSLKIRDIQEQPRLTWLPKMQMSEFRRRFSQYPDHKKVQPHGRLLENDLSQFTVRNDLKENEVEVIMFFEKWEDRLSIIANGVMLTEPHHPMPFVHKDYPFVWGGFEELDPFFVYDMPLTIKLLDMQDVNNEVLNLTLDMVWRALNEAILVQEDDGINTDIIYGGGILPVKDPKNFQKLDFGSSFGFQAASSVMDRVKRSIESSSVDAAVSGQAGSRPNVTAREVLIAREAALEIATLFLNNMENMERDKAYLRVKNQLDRYNLPVEWEKRIGKQEADEAIPVFREISVRDARMDTGKRGTVNVNITEEPRPREQLETLNVRNDKEPSQTIDISPEFIREIDFEVEIVANSSVRKSKNLEVAEARAFLKDAAAMPNVLSVPFAAKEYVKKLGKNEDEALVTAPGMQGSVEQMLAQRAQGGSPQATSGGAEVGETPIPTDSIEAIMNQEL